jgi:hypothetical protein
VPGAWHETESFEGDCLPTDRANPEAKWILAQLAKRLIELGELAGSVRHQRLIVFHRRTHAAPRRVVREPSAIPGGRSRLATYTGQVLLQASPLGEDLSLEPSALRVVHVPAPFRGMRTSSSRLLAGPRYPRARRSDWRV